MLEIVRAGVGERERAHPALEQRDTQLLLQRLDLMTHCGGCDVKLLRRRLEALQPGRDLERLEKFERWQSHWAQFVERGIDVVRGAHGEFQYCTRARQSNIHATNGASAGRSLVARGEATPRSRAPPTGAARYWRRGSSSRPRNQPVRLRRGRRAGSTACSSPSLR